MADSSECESWNTTKTEPSDLNATHNQLLIGIQSISQHTTLVKNLQTIMGLSLKAICTASEVLKGNSSQKMNVP